MEKCTNCASDNIDGQAIQEGYIHTCLDCGWWESERTDMEVDWVNVWMIILIILFVLVACFVD